VPDEETEVCECNDDPKLTDEEWSYVIAMNEKGEDNDPNAGR
jgi:hypothetical protein